MCMGLDRLQFSNRVNKEGLTENQMTFEQRLTK